MRCNVVGEARGIERKISSKGKEYYAIYCEDIESGKPFSLSSSEPLNISKGVTYNFYCEVYRSFDYMGFSILSVSPVVV